MIRVKHPLRRLARNTLWNLVWPACRCTASGRALPDFLGLGSQRAGSTSLHHWLAQHPLLRPALIKEVHYFDGGLPAMRPTWPRGPLWYAAHFPLRSRLPTGGLCYETSPLYLMHPIAPRRVAATLPHAKMIVVLRDPTERAISHYFHERERGREPLSLAAAIDAEEARLAPSLASRDYNTDAFVNKSYKLRGEYAGHLERWFSAFPRSSFLVLKSEELFISPQRVLRLAFDFLGVEDCSASIVTMPLNRARRTESVDPAVRSHLDRYFAPHNERLAALLGGAFGGVGHQW